MDELPDLSSVRSLKELLAARGLRPRQRLGQNFLVDRKALARIVAAVDPQPEDVVLEIGPGPGVLTRALSRHAARVLAVELDEQMVALLGQTLADRPNVQVVHADAMKVDLAVLLGAHLPPGRRGKAAANLPYYITSPLLFRLLEESLPLSRIVVLVQREVADRMVAPPGGKEYGALSVAVQYYTEPRLVARVPRGAFWPVPEVDSAVVAMEVRARPAVAAPPALFFAAVKAAFGQRRKTLLNAVSAGLNRPREQVEAALAAAGLDPGRRGETLTLAEFAALARALENSNSPDAGMI